MKRLVLKLIEAVTKSAAEVEAEAEAERRRRHAARFEQMIRANGNCWLPQDATGMPESPLGRGRVYGGLTGARTRLRD